MARTPSKMISLGSKIPNFLLPNVINDDFVSLQDFSSKKGAVILFICNHCPFVIHINSVLVKIANAYQSKGIQFIAISSNDVTHYPQDAPALMKKVALENAYPFPYLFDESQEVAIAFNAACTPDIFVYNANDILIYRGQFDASRPQNGIEVTGSDLKFALDCLLKGVKNTRLQKPSIGCNIKWKK